MVPSASSSSRNRLLLAVVLSVAGHALLFVGAGFFIRPPEIPLTLGALRVAVGMRMPAAATAAPAAPIESEAAPPAESKQEAEPPVANQKPVTSPKTATNPIPPTDIPQAATTAAGPRETAAPPPGSAAASEASTGQHTAPTGAVAGPQAVSFSSLASGVELALPSYPEAAKRWGYEGTVRIRLLVAADGEMEEVELIESSGHTMLDDEVLDTVRRKWSFPPPGREVVSTKSFTFRLSSR